MTRLDKARDLALASLVGLTLGTGVAATVVWREQVRALVVAVFVAGCVLVALAGLWRCVQRVVARPPMTEHLRPSDDERRLLERLR